MDTTNITQAISQGTAKGLFVLKKFSPEILTGVGIISVVAAGVMAANAGRNHDLVKNKIRHDRAEVEELYSESEPGDKTKIKEVISVYTRGAVEYGKLYGPAVALGASGVGCILGAHGIMAKRNANLLIATKAIETAFQKYRKRVIEELGIDQERDILAGIRETETKDDKGKKKIVVETADPNGYSPYAKFFDQHNQNFQNNAEYNLMFLKSQQEYANHVLLSRGHLFLNDVYKSLGLEPTKAGQFVGWTVSSESDNYVDFGMYDFTSEKARDFINGLEKSILLDFNVDGVIIDKIFTS